uniref:DUF2442 domain-containing protein n=1 Tax=uncultured bacterium CSLF42 TaxID=1091574 RepID=G4WW01_9BACT|nr:hypothetical protein [uncultured bacterium CSLF42]
MDITHVEAIANHRLRVTFREHGSKIFDLRPYLGKGIFKELKNERYFRKVRIVRGGIEWPHQQDLSAETLYYRSVPLR